MLFQPSGYELKIIDECELTRSELGFLRDDRQFAPKLLVSFPDYRPTGDFGFTGSRTKPITHVVNCLNRTPIMRFDILPADIRNESLISIRRSTAISRLTN